jgi:O-antigen ligase
LELLHGGLLQMSRFNNPKVLTAAAPPVARPPSLGAPESHVVSTLDRRPEPDQATPAAVTLPELQPSGIHKFCFVTLCVYLLSAYANEFSYRVLHSKAYISTVTIALLPILFALSGGIMQSVQVPLAKWYLAFGAWLAVCAPFSSWKSNTLEVLFTFYSKSFLLYFVICACVLRIREVRKLVFVLGIGTTIVVFACFRYGYVDAEGRFSVPSEGRYSFLANANELALGLILGILAILFQLLRKKMWMRAISFCVISAALYYALRTASRAGFLSIIATALAAFWLSKHKLKLAVLAVVVIPSAFLLLPAETRHRLLFIAVGHSVQVTNEAERSSLDSQRLREMRLLDSIKLTFQHPIFGVGPGDFMAADSIYRESSGQRATWLGTHNTYTQVSSEVGVPGFVFYLATIVVCGRMNYRVYKKTRGVKGLEDYAAVSFCMFLSIIAYAVGSFFDQLAYSTYLPIIAGVSSANYFAIRHALGGSLDAKAQQPVLLPRVAADAPGLEGR